MLIIGQTSGSGWADSRSQVSLIKIVQQGKNGSSGFMKIGTSILPIGDINKIIVRKERNEKHAEIIMAC